MQFHASPYSPEDPDLGSYGMTTQRAFHNPSLPTLRAGQSHKAVADLQGALKRWLWTSTTKECGVNNEKGCDSPSSIDGSGYFGAATKATVLAFQKAKGLGVDGIVGPNTWAKLGLQGSGGEAPKSELGPPPPNAAKIPSTATLTKSGDDATRKGQPALSKDALKPKFYEQSWFLPVAIGSGVLVLGILALTLSSGGSQKIVTTRPRMV